MKLFVTRFMGLWSIQGGILQRVGGGNREAQLVLFAATKTLRQVAPRVSTSNVRHISSFALDLDQRIGGVSRR